MADMRSFDIVAGGYRGYSGRAFISSATLTRPADTTQYSAGDQVAGATASPAALNFGTCATVPGAGGMIVEVTCIDYANQSTKPNQRLYIYAGSPTLNGDNAAWNPGSADAAQYLGVAEFTSWEVGGTGSGTAGNCFAKAKQLNIPYRCVSGATNLWGSVVERGTYTPISAEQWTIKLHLILD